MEDVVFVTDLSIRLLGLSLSVSSASIGRKELLGLVAVATVGVVLCKYIDVALGTSRNSRNAELGTQNSERRTRNSELLPTARSAIEQNLLQS
ncbi:hypothetical protein AOXY_G31700 [Acipenser oxyrinchus oxyrinchus]|uniref:Uncharacterized protein n=1 Tax=Acipenser oxyrinchus oxyrinchus TaxID=40147 RepID=A0AAD8FU56_ACIOX|nr:hypothetical protein AOXY_G31695 [Acipenser oxyrinchus oxyrinchus]KAK1152102.1 hypothetical protein AOXY_G31700 [Acipenser oxyrinchus oxyrinchus]